MAGGFAAVAWLSLTPVGAATADGSSSAVEHVFFRGNTVVSTDVLQSSAAPWLGRTLSADELEELREALTHAYTDRGYVNSGVVIDADAPAEPGTLHFRVIEGRIQTVRIRGLERLRPGYVIERVRREAKEVLNVNVLRERFQRLLDDPLFARINSRLLPGDQLGEATLDMDVVRARPYALSVALNNYRPPSIGEKAYQVAGLVRNLSGWGDVLDVEITGALNGSGGVDYSAGWLIPFTPFLTQASFRSSYADSVVTEEPLKSLDIDSRIVRQEFDLVQPLWLSARGQIGMTAGVAYERNWTSIADLPFSFLPGASAGVTRALTARLSPDFSFRSQRQYLGVRMTWLQANLLGAPSGPAAFDQPDHHYWVSTAQLHHILEIEHPRLELETRMTVQWTGAHISDLHTIEVGGIESVRGFRENELLLSNVRNLNIDLHWLAAQASGPRPAVTLGPFFDWASGHDVGQPTATLSSTGAAVKLRWTHVQADVAVGWHLIHPDFVDQQHGSWQDHGIHAQLLASL